MSIAAVNCDIDITNKVFYCGYLNNDFKPEGNGFMVNNNSDYIKGYFNNGISIVKNSKMKLNNNKFECDILNGIPDGDGKIFYQNGDIYNGSISLGYHHGKGRIIYKVGTIYDGEWNMGLKEGTGELIEDTYLYKGEWLNNKKHGKGEMKYSNTILNGEWYEDKKHGEFTETTDNNTIITKYENDVLVFRGDGNSNEILQLRRELDDEKQNTKKMIEERLCKICHTNDTNVVIIPCGHLLCSSCVQNLDTYQKKCPMCRARYTRHMEIYRS